MDADGGDATDGAAATAGNGTPDGRPADATARRGNEEVGTARPATGARLVLLAGIALGAYSLVGMATHREGMLAVNFEVYYHAAEAALSGADFYAVTPPDHPSYYFLYPPAAVLAFVPYVLAPPWPAFLVHEAVQVAGGLALAWLLVRSVERSGRCLSRVDRVLVAGFVVGSLHATPTHFFGNVNLLVALAMTVGFVRLEAGRERVAGVAFGLAALVKVIPAAVGVWLLRRRATRAVAAAVATGAAAFLLGAVVFGLDAHATYLHSAVLPRMEADRFAGGLDPGAPYVTLRRPLSVLFPTVDPALYSAGALALLAPVVAYCYRCVDGRVDRLVAIHATVTATLLFFPSYFVYAVFLYFPLVPLLFLLTDPRTRATFLAGAFVFNVAYTRSWFLAAVERAPLPDAVAGALDPLLTLGTPPLYGALLMLAGCVLHCRSNG